VDWRCSWDGSVPRRGLGRGNAAASTCSKAGSTVLRDCGALVRVVRTRGEGVVEAGGLHDPFPARSAPSGWDRPTEKKRVPPGRGAAWRAGRAATPAQNGGSRLKAGCPGAGRDGCGSTCAGAPPDVRPLHIKPCDPAPCHTASRWARAPGRWVQTPSPVRLRSAYAGEGERPRSSFPGPPLPRLRRGRSLLPLRARTLLLGVPADAVECDHVEGSVELAVAAAVEAVALLQAAGGLHGAGAGERRERRLACHAGGVAAGDDELGGARPRRRARPTPAPSATTAGTRSRQPPPRSGRDRRRTGPTRLSRCRRRWTARRVSSARRSHPR